MKKLNIKEAKALIKKYRSITIEGILEAMENMYLSAPRALLKQRGEEHRA